MGHHRAFLHAGNLTYAAPSRLLPHRLLTPVPSLSAQTFAQRPGGPLWFGLPISNILNSVVSLTVKADSLTLVTNQAPGLVLSAALCTFNNASCGAFTALNQRGYVHAVFKNTGYIAASFTLEVGCGDGELEAQSVSGEGPSVWLSI